MALLLIAGAIFAYKNFNKESAPVVEDSAKTTSEEPAAQDDFNVSEVDPDDKAKDRDPGNSIREDEGSAGVNDTRGTIPNNVSTSSPIVSQTGEISVYSPLSNQAVASEVTVAGASTLSTVMYRISDDVTGVLNTGSLDVVSGKFSGKLKISTGAKTGQVSFFGVKSDGNEFSNVTIPLKFN